MQPPKLIVRLKLRKCLEANELSVALADSSVIVGSLFGGGENHVMKVSEANVIFCTYKVSGAVGWIRPSSFEVSVNRSRYAEIEPNDTRSARKPFLHQEGVIAFDNPLGSRCYNFPMVGGK